MCVPDPNKNQVTLVSLFLQVQYSNRSLEKEPFISEKSFQKLILLNFEIFDEETNIFENFNIARERAYLKDFLDALASLESDISLTH